MCRHHLWPPAQHADATQQIVQPAQSGCLCRAQACQRATAAIHLASNKQQPLVPTSDECHEGISTQVQEANDTGSEHSDGIGQCYESDDKGWTDEEVDQHRIQEPNPEIVITETLLADAARGSATPGWLERRLAAHQRTLTQRLRRAVLIARAADEVHAIRNPGGERAPMNESEAEKALARRVKYLLGDEQIDSTSAAAVEAAIGVPAGTVFLLQAKQRCVLERKHAQKARQRDIESRRVWRQKNVTVADSRARTPQQGSSTAVLPK